MNSIASSYAAVRSRLDLLARAISRRFAALGPVVRRRLTGACEAAAEVASRFVAGARRLATRARTGSYRRIAAAVRIHAASAVGEAPTSDAGLYLAAWTLGLIAGLAGAPAVLLAPLALLQGAMKLALAAVVIAAAFGHLSKTTATRAGLHALRVGAAVALLWLVATSFALG